ncbi:MAG: hypothetical protein HY756_10625 [Nitrospirae bacterium]|nr:hypothetical protein [Nitrospirota bacterium]
MDIKRKIAQLIIARLDGNEINKKFPYYQSLVKKGIGGFIIFGGKLKDISSAIKRLQSKAAIPLFIASDLERGLGQQIEGGTLFPSQTAIAKAINPKSNTDIKLLRKSINIISKEAVAAGVNLIFSPVVDVNTNPRNPIISIRAFSDKPKEVSWFGNEFIRGFQEMGLIACAKHFPGHGDTSIDSHIKLPVVKANIKRLRDVELYPFQQAIKAGVKSIMIGHLKVPAIDPQLPASLSEKTIKGLLKNKMKFKGLVITDAMNMQSIKIREEKACLIALKAGADIILHPSNPEEAIDYLASRYDEIKERAEESYKKIRVFKKGLSASHSKRLFVHSVGTRANWDLANKLTKKSINVIGKLNVQGAPLLLIIDDDNSKSGKAFLHALRKNYKKARTCYIDNNSPLKNSALGTRHSALIIAVFSKVSAWKGRSGISNRLNSVIKKAIKESGYSVLVGFCSPYLLKEFKADVVIEAYSESEQAQKAAAQILFSA